MASTAARRAAVWGKDELADASAVDAVVTAALQGRDVTQLHDAAAFVKFLRAGLGHLPISCADVVSATADGEPTVAELRFDTLVRTLREGVPPFSVRVALELASAADSLAARREPFERPRYATDVAQHAALASSDATKGRVLSSLVRFMRARHVVDIGTAYGMSALFMAQELPPDGRIVTMEISVPQLSVSAEMLASEPRIQRIAGASQDVVSEVQRSLPTVDVVCHDGEHSHAAYVRDFDAYLPLMPAGSVWFLDDIRWEDERVSDNANTYEGWLEVTRHPRVRRAVELDDGAFGLLQLR
jgi:predicted O-methyltransferase YrrM